MVEIRQSFATCWFQPLGTCQAMIKNVDLLTSLYDLSDAARAEKLRRIRPAIKDQGIFPFDGSYV